MSETLTFSPAKNGWTSRHSFIPEMMIGLNGNFYSFNNGEIYKHNVNDTRCEYYDTQYDSSVTTVLNDGNDIVKV